MLATDVILQHIRRNGKVGFCCAMYVDAPNGTTYLLLITRSERAGLIARVSHSPTPSTQCYRDLFPVCIPDATLRFLKWKLKQYKIRHIEGFVTQEEDQKLSELMHTKTVGSA